MLYVCKGLHQLTLALRIQGLAGIADLNSQYDTNEKSQNINDIFKEQHYESEDKSETCSSDSCSDEDHDNNHAADIMSHSRFLQFE